MTNPEQHPPLPKTRFQIEKTLRVALEKAETHGYEEALFALKANRSGFKWSIHCPYTHPEQVAAFWRGVQLHREDFAEEMRSRHPRRATK